MMETGERPKSVQPKRKRAIDKKVRLSTEEHQLIEAKLARSGLSFNEFMIRSALGRKIAPAADSQAIAELKRLGGLQKHLFNQGQGVLSVEYAAILQEIKHAIQKL